MCLQLFLTSFFSVGKSLFKDVNSIYSGCIKGHLSISSGKKSGLWLCHFFFFFRWRLLMHLQDWDFFRGEQCTTMHYICVLLCSMSTDHNKKIIILEFKHQHKTQTMSRCANNQPLANFYVRLWIYVYYLIWLFLYSQTGSLH